MVNVYSCKIRIMKWIKNNPIEFIMYLATALIIGFILIMYKSKGG